MRYFLTKYAWLDGCTQRGHPDGPFVGGGGQLGAHDLVAVEHNPLRKRETLKRARAKSIGIQRNVRKATKGVGVGKNNS